MSWRKLEEADNVGKFDEYDVVVRKKYTYFPKNSNIWKTIERIGIKRYDLYVDVFEGRIALCFRNDGKFAFPSDGIINKVRNNNMHSVTRAFREILGVGKFKGKEEIIKIGNKYYVCYVFGGDVE